MAEDAVASRVTMADHDARRDARTVLRALWTRTRIPMTRANALAYAEAIFSIEPSVMRDAIDALVLEGAVLADGDDDGALLLWPGEDRPALGPKTLEEALTLERLEREASVPAPVKTPAWMLAKRAPDPVTVDKKSVLASGALSLVFGPVGWIYAAPMSEALPAIIAFGMLSALAGWLLPATLASVVLTAASIGSGLMGMAYAQRYNERGRRTPLLSSGGEK
jgi:hypothetical protein